MSKETLDEIIEMLKFGIDNHNWSSVEEAYDYLVEEVNHLTEE